MLFLTKHWRWIVPATLVVLCIIVGTFVVVRNDVPQEPKTVYVMPERTGNASINTGRTASPMVTARPDEPTKANQNNISVDHLTTSTSGIDSVVSEQSEQLETRSEGEIAPSVSSKDISDIEVSDEELAKQLEHFAQVAPEYQQIITEAEEIIKDIYDTDAKILRPKSFAERREYLVQYRADLATASEDDEDLEMIDDLVSTFISEMNDRGVYFE